MMNVIYVDGILYGQGDNFVTMMRDVKRLMMAGVENTRIRYFTYSGNAVPPATLKD